MKKFLLAIFGLLLSLGLGWSSTYALTNVSWSGTNFNAGQTGSYVFTFTTTINWWYYEEPLNIVFPSDFLDYIGSDLATDITIEVGAESYNPLSASINGDTLSIGGLCTGSDDDPCSEGSVPISTFTITIKNLKNPDVVGVYEWNNQQVHVWGENYIDGDIYMSDGETAEGSMLSPDIEIIGDPVDPIGCRNYSGATWLGAIVLNPDGTVPGCETDSEAWDTDLIPGGDIQTWTDYWFDDSDWIGYFSPRLGWACDDCWIGSDEEDGSAPIPFGFEINYFGQTFDGVFINSNGSVSFWEGSEEYDDPLYEIIGDQPGLCVYCIDLENNDQLKDTDYYTWGSGRHAEFFYWGRLIYNDRPAFAATWINMPTYNSTHNEEEGYKEERINSFQILFVDISDSNDDVDIIFNYGSIANYYGQGYDCDDEDYGDCKVAIGFGTVDDEDNVTFYSLQNDNGDKLNGMFVSELMDDGSSALQSNRLNSNVNGRYVFSMINGGVAGIDPDELPVEPCPMDMDSCGPTAVQATGGDTIVNLSWDSPEIDGSVHPFPTFNGYDDMCYWNQEGSTPLDDCFFQYTISVFSGDNQIGDTVEFNDESTHSYQATGLTNGQEYRFEVCVQYRNGENEPGSPICTTVYATPKKITPPTNNGGGGVGGGGRLIVASDPTSPNTMNIDTTDDSTTSETSPNASLDPEVQDAYDFAFAHGLTTLSKDEVRLTDPLNRAELAKMITAFAKNILGREETQTCDITTYSDYTLFDEEMASFIKQACNLGIMGWKNDKTGLIDTFRPFDLVTRAEFGAVLSRLLYGNTYNGSTGEGWYQAHLEALQTNSVMKHIDVPFTYELRQWALVMFHRVSK